MMAMLRSETARLGHRDPRQRRRAIRALFDLDDPQALSAFEPLLEDDQWFKSKAMDAIRRWYPGDSPEIANRLSRSKDVASRRLAAEVLPRRSDFDRAKVLLRSLCEDEDDSVRLQAWKSYLSIPGNGDEEVSRAMEDSSAAVRILALKVSVDSDSSTPVLSTALEDPNERVVARALELMSSRWAPSKDEVEGIARLLRTSRSDNLRAAALDLLLSLPTFDLSLLNPAGWRRPVRPAVIDSLARGLSEREWWKDDRLVSGLCGLESASLLPRLLRGAEDTPRVRIIGRLMLDRSQDAIMRMRLIENIVGRSVPTGLQSALEHIALGEEPDLAALAMSALGRDRIIAEEE